MITSDQIQSLINELQHQITAFLQKDLTVYPNDLTQELNRLIQHISNLLGVHVPSSIITRVNFHEAKRARVAGINYSSLILYHENPPRKPTSLVITLRFDVFNDPLKRALFLLYEAFHYFFSFHTTGKEKDEVSKKLSLAVLFDLSTSKHVQKIIQYYWEQLSPPIKFSLTNVFDLKTYVSSIHYTLPTQYSAYIFSLLKQGKRIGLVECFRFPFSIRNLHDTEKRVFIQAIKTNTLSPSVLSEKLHLTTRHTQRILSRLRSLFFLRKRWFLDLQALQLQSVFLGFTLDHTKIQYLDDYESPYLRNALRYNHDKNHDAIIMNFYFPTHRYAQQRIHTWLQKLKQDMDASRYAGLFFVGKEQEAYRAYSQNPCLLMRHNDPLNAHPACTQIHYPTSTRDKEQGQTTKLTHQEKNLALLMYTKGLYSFEEVYSYVKTLSTHERLSYGLTKNRNSLHEVYYALLTKQAIRKTIVMPFFSELERVFLSFKLSFNQEQTYHEYVNIIARQYPVANTTWLDTGHVISFIGLRHEELNRFQQWIQKKFPTSLFLKEPTSLETTPKLRLISTRTSWKFKTPMPFKKIV